MSYRVTITNAKELAAKRQITCSMVASMIGDLLGTKHTHAEQHMTGDQIFGEDRSLKDGSSAPKVGVEDHLQKNYSDRGDAHKKIKAHSMFCNPEDAVMATTAALNSSAGADALANLTGVTSIDLHSRTGASTVSEMLIRNNQGASVLRTKKKPDHVRVCLRKLGNDLKISSSFPIDSAPTFSIKADEDCWTQLGGGAKSPHPFKQESKPTTSW